MICKLCGFQRPLIDAHIIPRPFFGEVDGGRQRAKVLSNRHREYPKRLPIGFYDPGILCAPCDNAIGAWDAYGIQVLIQERDLLKPMPGSSTPIAFVRADFAYNRLKLFFLSVLWRAHESSLPFFGKVRLGPHRQSLFEMILNGEAGPPESFSVLLSAFTVDSKMPDIGAPILDPYREKWGGVNAYRLSFGTITAYIKVDRRPFRDSFEQLILKPGRPLALITRELAGAAEARVARSIAHVPQNRRAFPREQ